MNEQHLKTVDGDCKHVGSTMLLISAIVFLFMGTGVLRLGNEFLGYSLLLYILAAIFIVFAVIAYLRENRK